MRLLIFTGALFFWSTSAEADLVYSTFGSPPPGYSATDGASIAGPGFPQLLGGPLGLAEQFVPSMEVFVDTVDLALSFPSNLSIDAMLTIVILPNIEPLDPNLPDRPGAAADFLASVTVPLPTNVSHAVITADFNSENATFGISDGLLSPGTAYWVAAYTNGSNELIWNDTTDLALESFQASSTDGGLTWNSVFRSATPADEFPPLAAFSVTGTLATIPEPSAFIFLAASLCIYSVVRLRFPRQMHCRNISEPAMVKRTVIGLRIEDLLQQARRRAIPRPSAVSTSKQGNPW